MYEYRANLKRVIDGDTIEAVIDLGFNIKFVEKIRLLGINAPEIFGVKKGSEEYLRGLLAKEFLEKRLANGFVVKTQKDKKGKYGRYIGELFVDNVNVCDEMVKKSLAEAKDY